LDVVEMAIEKVKQGLLQEYRHIVQQYQVPVFRYCYHMLGAVEEAEDAVQEVFIKAYRKLDRYKEGTSFSSWLYKIAYNHCVDHLRKRRYCQFVPLCDSIIGDSDTMSCSLENDELSQPLQQAISKLSPDDRTILMLRVLEEKSYEEIAGILGKRSSTVRKRYERLRKKLQQSINETKGVVIDGKFAVNQ